MGIFKITDLKGVLSPDYDEDDEYDMKDDYLRLRNRSPFTDHEEEYLREHERRSGVVSVHTTTRLQVLLVKPTSFENAAEIGGYIKERRTMVLNMESVKREAARRLIDFISGAVYATEGTIKKVATNTYLITPDNVDIAGDLLDELDAGNYSF